MISYVFKNGFDTARPKNQYLDIFLIDSKNNFLNIQNSSKGYRKKNHIYAYLSIFGKNVRSFVNVYNYLYVHAVEISKSNLKRASEYWDIEKFSEFINVIIESKYTFSQHTNTIKKFLSIKYDEVDKEHVIVNNMIRNLRIDCEELKILIGNILSREEDENSYFKKDDYPNNKKGEIDSILMLAIFINEIYYVIHEDGYDLRHMRVQNKLKKILCDFINCQNDSIQILPTNLSMNNTLVFYYRIISRMSTRSLKEINNNFIYNEYYYISDTKKYFVQIYFALILIITNNFDKETFIDKYIEYYQHNLNLNFGKLKMIELYDYYQKSTYQEFVPVEKNLELKTKRCYFEKFIVHQLTQYFKGEIDDRNEDYEWLNDKIRFLDNYYNSIVKIFDEIDKKYLNRIYSTFVNKKKSTNLLKINVMKRDSQIKEVEIENTISKQLGICINKVKDEIYDICYKKNFKYEDVCKCLIQNYKIKKNEFIKNVNSFNYLAINSESGDDSKNNQDKKYKDFESEFINDSLKNVFKLYFEKEINRYCNINWESDLHKEIFKYFSLYYYIVFISELIKNYTSEDFKFFEILKKGLDNHGN